MDDVSDEVNIVTDQQTVMCGLIRPFYMAQITLSQVTCCSLSCLQEEGNKLHSVHENCRLAWLSIQAAVVGPP